MANTKAFQYYRLEEKHLNDVKYIFLKAFNKKVSINYLKHKYDCSYLNISPVATIAYDGKNPIAFYGAIPQLFQSEHSQFLVAHACDSFTLPAYQKKGIHYKLAQESYKLMKTCNIKMVYAYHSENTYYSTKKLDWKEHLEMKRFHFFTGSLPMTKIYNKINLTHLISRKARRIFEPYLTDHINNPIAKENKTHHLYSQSFFDYKDGFNQHYTIAIESCIFYVKIGAILQVGYTDFQNIESLMKGIETLKNLCKKIGVNEILFQVDPGSKQYEGLSALAEGLSSWLIGYLSFDEQLEISDIAFNFADLDTF